MPFVKIQHCKKTFFLQESILWTFTGRRRGPRVDWRFPQRSSNCWRHVQPAITSGTCPFWVINVSFQWCVEGALLVCLGHQPGLTTDGPYHSADALATRDADAKKRLLAILQYNSGTVRCVRMCLVLSDYLKLQEFTYTLPWRLEESVSKYISAYCVENVLRYAADEPAKFFNSRAIFRMKLDVSWK